MQTFYFTYGSEGHPFFGGWTEIIAENEGIACQIFRAVHPDKTPGYLNCCSVYNENCFKNSSMHNDGNFGYYCHERITLQRELLPMKGDNL